MPRILALQGLEADGDALAATPTTFIGSHLSSVAHIRHEVPVTDETSR
ncbi:hypothetical protein ACIQOW_24750 [Kitasatospora sp. NPDC091335]